VGLWGNPERRAIKTQDGAFLYVLRLDLKCSIVDLKVPCSDFGRRSGGVHSFSANVGSSRPSSPLCSTNLIVAIPVLQQAHGCGSKLNFAIRIFS